MINIIENDYGYRLQFKLYDVNGTAFDLSQPDEIKFRWNHCNQSTYYEDTMTRTTNTGECYFVPTSTAFAEDGAYYGQIIFDYSTKRISVTDFVFDAKKGVPK